MTIQTLTSPVLTLATSPQALNAIDKLWLRRSASDSNGIESDGMFMYIFWFCVVWFVLLMGLMTYFVIVYRRRPGKIAPRSSSHNTAIEIAWTVIPTLFLVHMFFVGFFGYMDKMVAPGDATEMSLKGFKWGWSVTYPNGMETTQNTVIGTQEVPIFYMPAETAIRMKMSSNDVIHAFWVPDFRIKQDVQPNRYTSVWFKAHRPTQGEEGVSLHPANEAEAIARNEKFIAPLAGKPYRDHWVFCAEYCGDNHSEMAAIIRVVESGDFQTWVDWTADFIGTKTPLTVRGEQLWKAKCSSCHTIDGTANTGPTWKNIFGHEVDFTDGSKLTAEQMRDPVVFDNYIRESILVPSAKIVKGFGNNMASWQGQLGDKEITALTAFMKSTKVTVDGGVDPAKLDGDYKALQDAQKAAEEKK